jgi:hypothetical protein
MELSVSLDAVEKRNVLVPGWILLSPARSLVVLPTGLSWLLQLLCVVKTVKQK